MCGGDCIDKEIRTKTNFYVLNKSKWHCCVPSKSWHKIMRWKNVLYAKQIKEKCNIYKHIATFRTESFSFSEVYFPKTDLWRDNTR